MVPLTPPKEFFPTAKEKRRRNWWICRNSQVLSCVADLFWRLCELWCDVVGMWGCHYQSPSSLKENNVRILCHLCRCIYMMLFRAGVAAWMHLWTLSEKASYCPSEQHRRCLWKPQRERLAETEEEPCLWGWPWELAFSIAPGTHLQPIAVSSQSLAVVGHTQAGLRKPVKYREESLSPKEHICILFPLLLKALKSRSIANHIS